MDSRFERQLKRGALEMLVLSLVCDTPAHGYELLSEIAQRSGGALTLKEGTLYPVLYRLEDDGCIVSEWSASGRAAPKKVYRVTDAGREELARERRIWNSFCRMINQFVGEETP